jgi:hypothetical protein
LLLLQEPLLLALLLLAVLLNLARQCRGDGILPFLLLP